MVVKVVVKVFFPVNFWLKQMPGCFSSSFQANTVATINGTGKMLPPFTFLFVQFLRKVIILS